MAGIDRFDGKYSWIFMSKMSSLSRLSSESLSWHVVCAGDSNLMKEITHAELFIVATPAPHEVWGDGA